MADKLMYIINDDTLNSSSLDYNYWLKSLDTKLNNQPIKFLINVPKVFNPTNNKVLLQNFGD